jgi:2-iminobutanoate/2-iminopropanoate deaminase
MEEIQTDEAASNSFPYSQAIRDDNTVYVSGHIGTDPDTGEVVDGDVGPETEQTLENIEAVLEAAGTSLDNVVKTTVYLTDEDGFEAFNDAYGSRMNEPFPARSTVVTGLVADAAVEIDVVAKIE